MAQTIKILVSTFISGGGGEMLFDHGQVLVKQSKERPLPLACGLFLLFIYYFLTLMRNLTRVPKKMLNKLDDNISENVCWSFKMQLDPQLLFRSFSHTFGELRAKHRRYHISSLQIYLKE